MQSLLMSAQATAAILLYSSAALYLVERGLLPLLPSPRVAVIICVPTSRPLDALLLAVPRSPWQGELSASAMIVRIFPTLVAREGREVAAVTDREHSSSLVAYLGYHLGERGKALDIERIEFPIGRPRGLALSSPYS